MSDRFLSISQVQMRFERNGITNPVLKDINLEVNRGEYISLIGHSGCGKSTVLNIIAGLLTASEGVVIVDNKEVNAPGPDRALVFQNHSLLPWLTVYQNVELAVEKIFKGKKSRKEQREWILYNLDMVNIEPRAGSFALRNFRRHETTCGHCPRTWADGTQGAVCWTNRLVHWMP